MTDPDERFGIGSAVAPDQGGSQNWWASPTVQALECSGMRMDDCSLHCRGRMSCIHFPRTTKHKHHNAHLRTRKLCMSLGKEGERKCVSSLCGHRSAPWSMNCAYECSSSACHFRIAYSSKQALHAKNIGIVMHLWWASGIGKCCMQYCGGGIRSQLVQARSLSIAQCSSMRPKAADNAKRGSTHIQLVHASVGERHPSHLVLAAKACAAACRSIQPNYILVAPKCIDIDSKLRAASGICT